MLVGGAVGSENLNAGQRGPWARLHHEFHRDQLTCVAEPQAWEQLGLWAKRTLL